MKRRNSKHGKPTRQRQKGKGSSTSSSTPTASSTSSTPTASSTSTAPAGAAGSAEAAGSSTGGMMMPRWWERWPGRKEHELEQLRASGVTCREDEGELAKGKLVLHLEAKVEGEPIRLIVRFPDLYPDVRFEMIAPDLQLSHHQNPFEKNLCLIGQASENWKPSDTVAFFIEHQLPLVIRTANATADEAKGLEEPQAEPIGFYYPPYDDACFLVDSSWNFEKTVTRGRLVLGLEQRRSKILRGAVLKVTDFRSRLLVEAENYIQRYFEENISARWVRLSSPIVEEDGNRFAAKLFQQIPRFEKPEWQTLGGLQVDVIGIIYPEETEWRKSGDGWLFLVRVNSPTKNQIGTYFARTIRTGNEDLLSRVPTLQGLESKKISVMGAGCVGAPFIIEMARAGLGEIRVIDDDFVEGGTIVRWPLGFSAFGKRKVEMLRDFVEKNYPRTKLIPYAHRMGATYKQTYRDAELIPTFLGDADAIVDASAEPGFTALLARLAAEANLPFISLSATPGAWGGLVVRIRPGVTEGCWHCFLRMMEDNTISSPPYDPSELIQPIGCAAPTFTGAAFDVQQVSLAGVRMVVSTVTPGKTSSYPTIDWDVEVISLRDKSGIPIGVQTETFNIEKHAKCTNHLS